MRDFFNEMLRAWRAGDQSNPPLFILDWQFQFMVRELAGTQIKLLSDARFIEGALDHIAAPELRYYLTHPEGIRALQDLYQELTVTGHRFRPHFETKKQNIIHLVSRDRARPLIKKHQKRLERVGIKISQRAALAFFAGESARLPETFTTEGKKLEVVKLFFADLVKGKAIIINDLPGLARLIGCHPSALDL